MCGRYVIKTSTPEIARLLGADGTFLNTPARYNVAPTQDVPICRLNDAAGRVLEHYRWGLIPAWSKDGGKNAYSTINARGETAHEKPAFRSPFKSRRCLIPADGYYEWKSVQGRKQPYYFSMQDGTPFCFAGVWERWQPADGEPVESCAIITTDANALGAKVHPRMPVILAAEDHSRWLDPRVTQPEAVLPLLRPFPPEAMTVYPVSTLVNNARSDEPRCITPLADH